MFSKVLEEVVKVIDVTTGEIRYVTVSELNKYDYIRYERV